MAPSSNDISPAPCYTPDAKMQKENQQPLTTPDHLVIKKEQQQPALEPPQHRPAAVMLRDNTNLMVLPPMFPTCCHGGGNSLTSILQLRMDNDAAALFMPMSPMEPEEVPSATCTAPQEQQPWVLHTPPEGSNAIVRPLRLSRRRRKPLCKRRLQSPRQPQQQRPRGCSPLGSSHNNHHRVVSLPSSVALPRNDHPRQTTAVGGTALPPYLLCPELPSEVDDVWKSFAANTATASTVVNQQLRGSRMMIGKENARLPRLPKRPTGLQVHDAVLSSLPNQPIRDTSSYDREMRRMEGIHHVKY